MKTHYEIGNSGDELPACNGANIQGVTLVRMHEEKATCKRCLSWQEHMTHKLMHLSGLD